MLESGQGFTLVEILIALFIFTILSMMMLGGLRAVINTQARVEMTATRLRDLQMALLILSRDVEQAVNRPVLTASGTVALAFTGSPQAFTFTHMGLANPDGTLVRSSLGRSQYYWADHSLWRASWPVLDRAGATQWHARRLLAGVSAVSFSYLDKAGRFNRHWPVEKQGNQPLPRAVRVQLTLPNAGEVSQLYVISAENAATVPAN